MIAGTGSSAAAVTAGDATTGNQDAATGGDATTSGNTGATSGVGDFGSCSVPQIEFAAGFDNRKETSFQPVDLRTSAFALLGTSLLTYHRVLQPWLRAGYWYHRAIHL